MNSITKLWNAVWRRDSGTCQICKEKHTHGNTHTVTTLFLENPLHWQEAEEDILIVACIDCIMSLRDFFRRRYAYLEQRGKKAEDAGSPPKAP